MDLKKDLDLSMFFCPNKDCRDYGKKGLGNIVLKERYGKHDTALLKCRSCKKTFSENKGTVFFGLKTEREKVLMALKIFAEKCSIRGTARAMGVKPDTIMDWLRLAGEHCEEVMKYLIEDLHLTQIQADEICSLLKKRRRPS